MLSLEQKRRFLVRQELAPEFPRGLQTRRSGLLAVSTHDIVVRGISPKLRLRTLAGIALVRLDISDREADFVETWERLQENRLDCFRFRFRPHPPELARRGPWLDDPPTKRLVLSWKLPAPLAKRVQQAIPDTAWIERRRWRNPEGRGDHWLIDVFTGANHELITAEVALDGTAHPELPPWVGDEITSVSIFANTGLVNAPFSMWDQQTRDKVRAGTNPFPRP